MSAQGDKFRNRPEEDLTTRRTAEEELMRGDRGVGQTGDGASGGSGTAGGGMENEGTGSLLVERADEVAHPSADDDSVRDVPGNDEDEGSGSTQGGRTPGVSGRRGMSSPLEKEGEGHSGPIRSGSPRRDASPAERDRAAGGASSGEADDNAREGYEDHGSSRDSDGTQGESSGSRPGYR